MVFWINNPFDHLPGEGHRAQRYTLLCRSLAKHGHTVIFWSGDFNHALKRKRTLESIYTTPDGYQVRQIPVKPYPDNICWQRIISHQGYALKWWELGKAAVESGDLQRPDVILTSTPPLSTAKIARAFRKKWGCKIVVDIMDAWPETFYRLLPLPKSWQQALGPLIFSIMRNSARKAYQQADAISAVGLTYLDVARQYKARCPMHLCYHGIARLNNGAYRYALASTEPLRVAYIGNMGRSYDLATVIKGVKELHAEGVRVRLDLAGKGPKEEELRKLAAGCPVINFFGYLSDEDMGQLLADSDVAVIPMFQDSYVAVPYKLADYTSAGLPIINSLTGETKAMLDMYQAGTFYTAGSVVSFKSALMRYITKPSLITQESVASARIARERFMLDTIYPEFVRFLSTLDDAKPSV